jgi:hypothetical protein
MPATKTLEHVIGWTEPYYRNEDSLLLEVMQNLSNRERYIAN